MTPRATSMKRSTTAVRIGVMMLAPVLWANLVRAQAQTNAQQACITTAHKAGARVVVAHLATLLTCAKRFDAAAVPSVDSCVDADDPGKRSRAADALARITAKKCAALQPPPDFGYVGAPETLGGALDAGGELARSIFGTSATSAVAAATTAIDRTCRQAALKGVAKLFGAYAKQTFLAQRRALKGETSAAGVVPPVASASALQDSVGATLDADPDGDIAKADAKFRDVLRKSCASSTARLDSLFPGDCSQAGGGDVEALSACMIRRQRCAITTYMNESQAWSLPCTPSCDQVGISESQLRDALSSTIPGFDDPWGQVLPLLEAVAANLGCRLPIEPPSATVAPLVSTADAASCVNCQDTYCLGVRYCGKGDSSSTGHPIVLCDPVFGCRNVGNAPFGKGCLNQACFDHDKCYRQQCVKDYCFFSPQGDLGQCDRWLIDACDTCGSLSFAERGVCALVHHLKDTLSPLPPPGCETPPCGTDELCCQQTPYSNATQCEAGCKLWTARPFEPHYSYELVCRHCFIGCNASLQCPNSSDPVNSPTGHECFQTDVQDVGPDPGNLCMTQCSTY
jgi:hypothetical protein